MRKRIKKIAMLATATVAIGVASLTSCTKEEESLTNNVPAMELKNGEPEKQPFDTSIEFYWWFRTIQNNLDGTQDTTCTCIKHHLPQGPLCFIGYRLTKSDETPSVVTWVDGDGDIIKMKVKSSNISAEENEVFLDFVDRGIIVFDKDCPISDPNILEVSNKNHIPAGEYPIFMEDNDYIIILA